MVQGQPASPVDVSPLVETSTGAAVPVRAASTPSLSATDAINVAAEIAHREEGLVAISRFASLTATTAQPETLAWDDLTAELMAHREQGTKDGPGWSPAVYRSGATRSNTEVQAITAAVFDFDHRAPTWERLTGLAFVASTTWRHHNCEEYGPECEHWRVVVRLAEQCPADQWSSVWPKAKQLLAPEADDSCKDPARFYYSPSTKPGGVQDARIQMGTALDWRSLPATDADTTSRIAPLIAPVIPKGKRNSTLMSLAGSMRRRGMTADEMFPSLLKFNERSEPPLNPKEVGRIAENAGRFSAKVDTADGADAADGPTARKRDSASTSAISVASDARLFHSADRVAYATISVDGHSENWPLSSKGFQDWLGHRFYTVEGKALSGRAMADAIVALRGKALYEGPALPVFSRIAPSADAFYLDLGDAQWKAIEITASGWRLVDDPPIRFVRGAGMLALPEPVHGDAAVLRQFINLSSDDDWALIIGWLTASLRARGPYPLLILNGEQGSGKSTAARALKALIDPYRAPLRSAPRDERDLMIAATHAWIPVFDNLSHISGALSDALCRLATGGGLSTRRLYTDDEEVIFDVQRPVIINGIEDLATRGDLLDRAILIRLPSIGQDQRRPEANFWRDFESSRPAILGGLLDAAVVALREVPNVRLAALPRMADAAIWVTAAEPALGLRSGEFLSAYTLSRDEADEIARTSSLLFDPLLKVVPFVGTTTDLLSALRTYSEADVVAQRTFPRTAKTLGDALRRLAPSLRTAGIDISWNRRSDRMRTRIVEITNAGPPASAPSAPSAHMPTYKEVQPRSIGSAIAADDDRMHEAATDFFRPCTTCGGTEKWARPDRTLHCSTCSPSPSSSPAAQGASVTDW